MSDFFNRKKNRGGFTVIELALSITIGAIALLAMTAVYLTNQKAYRLADTKAEIVQNGRVITDRLVRDLRQTETIATALPADNTDHDNLPNEIIFRDGHDVADIRYIRYYQNGTELAKQVIAYYFSIAPNVYVLYNTTDQNGNPPLNTVLEEKTVGQYVQDIEFWGENLISINLELAKDAETEIIYTAVYGRNL